MYLFIVEVLYTHILHYSLRQKSTQVMGMGISALTVCECVMIPKSVAEL